MIEHLLTLNFLIGLEEASYGLMNLNSNYSYVDMVKAGEAARIANSRKIPTVFHNCVRSKDTKYSC